jgi:hypothetical protein
MLEDLDLDEEIEDDVSKEAKQRGVVHDREQ